MNTLLLQFLSGFATGGIYALLALSLAMIYRSTHHINFAQGEMALLSTYLASVLLAAGLPYWVAFTLTLAASFAIGMIIQQLILRPVQGASHLTAIIVFIGMMVAINGLVHWIFGGTVESFPSPFSRDAWYSNRFFPAHEVGMLLVIFIVSAAMWALFKFTRVGLAMRVSAFNPLSARLSGVPVGRMLAFGWGLAAMVGAVAGIMAAPILYLEPHMMAGVLIYGFAAALVGGIDNPWGAVAGGFLVGVIENLAGAYVVGTELKLSVALALIIGVLLIKPSGIFGRAVVSRV